MGPRLRKLVLTAHVISSVGWFGAVAVFLALAIAGLTSQDAPLVRATYLVMDMVGWFVIVPLCLASLLTGLVSSLGTTWGLFRHYWVVIKLLMTVPATVALLVHMQPMGELHGMAETTPVFNADPGGLRVLMVVASSAARVVLLLATVLSVYKPRGMTPYGWRKTAEAVYGLQP